MIAIMTIKTVLFDLDGTLYDYDTAHGIALQTITEEASKILALPPSAFQKLYQKSCREQKQHSGAACAAIHSRLIRFQLILEWLEQPLRYAPQWDRLYWETLMEHMTPTTGAVECMHRLKQTGYKLGVGTNMTADYQFEKLSRLGLLDDMDFIVSSEEAGAEKPDARLFQLCVEKSACQPEECAFVGDQLVSDAEGARKAGLLPVWLCPPDSTELLHIKAIHTFDELPDALASLPEFYSSCPSIPH